MRPTRRVAGGDHRRTCVMLCVTLRAQVNSHDEEKQLAKYLDRATLHQRVQMLLVRGRPNSDGQLGDAPLAAAIALGQTGYLAVRNKATRRCNFFDSAAARRAPSEKCAPHNCEAKWTKIKRGEGERRKISALLIGSHNVVKDIESKSFSSRNGVALSLPILSTSHPPTCAH